MNDIQQNISTFELTDIQTSDPDNADMVRDILSTTLECVAI